MDVWDSPSTFDMEAILECAEMSDCASESARDDIATPGEEADWMLWDEGEREQQLGGGSFMPGMVDGLIPCFSHRAPRCRSIFLWLCSRMSLRLASPRFEYGESSEPANNELKVWN